MYLISAVVLASGGYLLYEFGRLQGGYSALNQQKERIEVEAVLAERDESIDELQRQLTLLEISKEIDRITYDEVEKNLNQLQARVPRTGSRGLGYIIWK